MPKAKAKTNLKEILELRTMLADVKRRASALVVQAEDTEDLEEVVTGGDPEWWTRLVDAVFEADDALGDAMGDDLDF